MASTSNAGVNKFFGYSSIIFPQQDFSTINGWKVRLLNSRSNYAMVAFAIASIAALIIGIGATYIFGAKMGFIASMVGGGLTYRAFTNFTNQKDHASILRDSHSIERRITEAEEAYGLISTCMHLYHADQDAWVMVPPKLTLKSGAMPALAIGSASYEGAGHFKIHINLDPQYMERAIPIILDILYQEETPMVGLKFQTKKMLSGDHQIGKEFALIFSEEAEGKERTSHVIENLLSKLNALFEANEIFPEQGFVLTS